MDAPTDLPRPFGRYRLLRPLGSGGMGHVYEAELEGPAGFRKRVAIKILRPDLSLSGPEARAELAREARLGGLLSHANIVETYELGEVDGQLFVAMALVRGTSLRAVLRERAPLPARAALEVAIQVGQALAHIHSVDVDGRTGLVHRDLKPANILVDRDGGRVRLADLGIAALREAVGESSDRRGTPAYMAPEQIDGGALDPRTDLFSLGVVIYEMITGRRLFHRPSPPQVLLAILGADALLASPDILAPVDRAVPGLAPVLTSLLRCAPDQRLPDAPSLLAALRDLVAGAAGASLTDAFGDAQAHATGPPSLSSPSVLASEAPTVARRPATNLGPEPDTFVGRAGDLALLHARIAGARLVTLKGAGGTGKTRLSQRFARTHLDAWPGGVWSCDLTETRSLQGVLFAVGEALRVPIGGEEVAQLATQLGHAIAARGRTLILLDNFEQVVEAAAGTVGRWLELAPEARFLVTSRERLRIAGEDVLELGPLTDADAVELLRARAGDHGAWGAASETLDAIVRRLDQLPLAIELAAARSRLLSPEQTLHRLSRRLDLLRGGRRGAPARQATLRGAIDWSWSLLAPWEQGAMSQLSVFRGGFDLEDAEAVLDLSAWPDAPWEVDVVGSLLDKSLLVTRPWARTPRFAMYETIREFAAEELLDGDAVRDRHAARYAALAPVAGASLRRRAIEIDNLVAGCLHATARGELGVAARCCGAAASVYGRHGPIRSGLVLVDRVLAADPGPEASLRVLGAGAHLAVQAGLGDLADRYVERALPLARTLGNKEAEGASLHALAAICQGRGDMHDGHRYAVEALACYRETGSRAAEGAALGMLGRICTDLGRLAEGEVHLDQALAAARETGEREEEGLLLANIGLLYQHMGRVDEAHQCLLDSIHVLGEVGARLGVGRAHGNLGILLRRRGQPARARYHYETALSVYREVGSLSNEAIVLLNLGILLYMTNAPDEAEAHYRASLQVNRHVGSTAVEAANLTCLAQVCRGRGELGDAEAYYLQALALHRDGGHRRYEALLGGDLAVLALDRGRAAETLERMGPVLEMLREVGDRRMEAGYTRLVAHAHLELGSLERAETVAREAVDGLAVIGEPQLESLALTTLAAVLEATGRRDEALEVAARAVDLARIDAHGVTLAASLAVVARVCLANGDVDAATTAIEEALGACAGDVPAAAQMQGLRASCRAAAQDMAGATADFDASITGLEKAGHRLTLAKALLRRASLGGSAGGSPPQDIARTAAIVAELELPPEAGVARHLAILRSAPPPHAF